MDVGLAQARHGYPLLERGVYHPTGCLPNFN
jgi:hypothetical protein